MLLCIRYVWVVLELVWRMPYALGLCLLDLFGFSWQDEIIICGNLSEHRSEDSYSRVKSDHAPCCFASDMFELCLSLVCGCHMLWGSAFLDLLGFSWQDEIIICGNLSEHRSEDSYSRVKSDHAPCCFASVVFELCLSWRMPYGWGLWFFWIKLLGFCGQDEIIICGNLSEHRSEDSYSRVKSDHAPCCFASVVFELCPELVSRMSYMLWESAFLILFGSFGMLLCWQDEIIICGNLSEHRSEDSYSRVKSDRAPCCFASVFEFCLRCVGFRKGPLAGLYHVCDFCVSWLPLFSRLFLR